MVVGPILSSLAMIFILIVPGFIFRKLNIISDTQNDGINHLVMNLTWPALVISAMQMEYNARILKDSLYILIVCLIVLFAVLLISIPFSNLLKLEKSKRYLTVFMVIFGNTGFIGIPVINALYGSQALFFAALIELINDMLIFTVGVFLIQASAGSSLKMSPKQLLSPGLMGVIIGFILFILKIQLPQLLGGSLDMIGSATTPLTMFVIGFQVAGLSFKEFAGEIKVYAICLMKLLIVPIVLLVVIKLYAGDLTLLEKVLVLSFAMPVGAVSAIFSKQYNTHPDFATKTVLLSTILSLITIPIFAIIMEL